MTLSPVITTYKTRDELTATWYRDDRTEEQQDTHAVLWGGTDTFLSGWGKALGKKSYAFWACRPEHAGVVEAWVRDRGDIARVRRVFDPYRPRQANSVVHIYVVHDEHPSLWSSSGDA